MVWLFLLLVLVLVLGLADMPSSRNEAFLKEWERQAVAHGKWKPTARRMWRNSGEMWLFFVWVALLGLAILAYETGQ